MKLGVRQCMIIWVVLGIGFAVPAVSKFSDPDLWWHLKTGQIITESGRIPAADPFSFTCHGKPWVAHEWLSDIVFYSIFHQFGFRGLVFLQALLISALFFSIFILVSRRTKNLPAALIITTLTGLAGIPFWTCRPQLFTYLLLAGLLILLDNPIHKRKIWLAAPMFALWSNLHGAWIFGYAVMLVVFTDYAIYAIKGGKRGEALRLAAVAAISLAAVLAGPSPMERLTYPLQYISGAIPSQYVAEFKSPDFHTLSFMPYQLLIISLPAAFYLGRKAMRPSQWILMLGLVHLSLTSGRHVPLFAIYTAPLLADQIEFALAKRPAVPVRQEIREFWVLNLILVLLIPFAVWAKQPSVNDEAHYYKPNIYPAGACNYLKSHPRIGRGRLLNNYNWGGYIIFHLYPKYLVSIDGRADVHAEHMVRDLKSIELGAADWKKVLNSISPDVVLWPVDKPLASLLRSDPGWRAVYEDKTAVVFVCRENKAAGSTPDGIGRQPGVTCLSRPD